MSTDRTAQVLAAFTDEGLFERMATAILRKANPIYSAIVHTGVNASGQTVKSPLDGICFVQGADPPHMIAFHHTITAREDLQKKWLHDPSKVRPRKGPKPTAPAGDLIKTAALVAEERTRTANLHATLVLTTNQEPDEALVREVVAAGRDRGLEIVIWSRSMLSDFLDNEPSGQWLRHEFLHIDQEQLSSELLLELSKKSLELNVPLDDPDAWIPRTLDATLKTSLRREVTFLVAGSGLGKSVACYRHLAAYVKNGGVGIILPHEAIASSRTLEQAVMVTLRQLHPTLATVSESVFSFCSPERPLCVVVEDINRSGQPQRLVEKIVGWSCRPTKDDKGISSRWQLVCPLWPEILALVGDQVRKRIEPLIVLASGFSSSEGRDAVLLRAKQAGRILSSLKAEEISRAFSYDPLLIALHDQSETPDPQQIIGRFVESSLSNIAAGDKDHPAADYRQALRALAGEMLANRQIELRWQDVISWRGLQGEPLNLLSRLAHQGDLMRFSGLSDDQRLSFRHDRVQDWVLTDAASELDRRDLLTEEVLAEPYFAEVIGAVLAWGQQKSNFLPRVAGANPLALFCALRLFGRASEPRHQAIIQAINDWLDIPATQEQSNYHLRWEALAILAETDSPTVPALVRKFRDRTSNGELARFRNGDLSGGIDLCSYLGPGTGAPWRDIQIEHVKLLYGRNLVKALHDFLLRMDLNEAARIGAIRLAGHIADPGLAIALEACWTNDDERADHLAEYLWAFGECCGDDPARYLGPVCDAWAALSDLPQKHGMSSPRADVAINELHWAFLRWPPVDAIEFFIQRGSKDDLNAHIIYMLHGVDHPKAILFVVQELAATRQKLEGTQSFSPFVMSASDDWRRAQDEGHPMSNTSRNALLALWQDENNDKHLRTQALSFWAATHNVDDLEVLHTVRPSDILADNVLAQRLIRGDDQAIPALLKKLSTDSQGYWWQYGRYIWSTKLTDALDEYFEKRKARASRIWCESFEVDWIICELIMHLQTVEAEQLLLKHWDHLRFCSHYIQTALFFATSRLQELASASISESPEPIKLLEHLWSHFGIRTRGRPGITREVQVLALVPYLQYLSSIDIIELWHVCNDNGWFVLRQKYLDNHLQPPFLYHRWDRPQMMSEFDKMSSERLLLMIDHKIDEIIKVDISWAEILETLNAWFGERRSFEALRVVAAAIKYRGTREDLAVLRIYEGMPETASLQLIADTKFAVSRRSVS